MKKTTLLINTNISFKEDAIKVWLEEVMTDLLKEIESFEGGNAKLELTVENT